MLAEKREDEGKDINIDLIHITDMLTNIAVISEKMLN